MLLTEKKLRQIIKFSLRNNKKNKKQLLNEVWMATTMASNMFFTWLGKTAGFLPEDHGPMITDLHTWTQLNLAMVGFIDPTAAPKKLGFPVPGLTDIASAGLYAMNDDPESAAIVLALGTGMKGFGQWRIATKSKKFDNSMKVLEEFDPEYATKIRSAVSKIDDEIADGTIDASTWASKKAKIDKTLIQTRIQARDQAYKLVLAAQKKGAKEFTEETLRAIAKPGSKFKHKVYAKTMDPVLQKAPQNLKIVAKRTADVLTDYFHKMTLESNLSFWTRAVNNLKKNYSKIMPKGNPIDKDSFDQMIDLGMRLDAWKLAYKEGADEYYNVLKKVKKLTAKSSVLQQLVEFTSTKAGKALDQFINRLTPKALAKKWKNFIDSGRLTIHYVYDVDRWHIAKDTLGQVKSSRSVKIDSSVDDLGLELTVQINMRHPKFLNPDSTIKEQNILNVLKHELDHVGDLFVGSVSGGNIRGMTPYMKETDEMFDLLKAGEAKWNKLLGDNFSNSKVSLSSYKGYSENPVEIWAQLQQAKRMMASLGRDPKSKITWRYFLSGLWRKEPKVKKQFLADAERLYEVFEDTWFAAGGVFRGSKSTGRLKDEKLQDDILTWFIKFGRVDIPPTKSMLEKTIEFTGKATKTLQQNLAKPAAMKKKNNKKVKRDPRTGQCPNGYRWQVKSGGGGKCVPNRRR